MAGQGRTAHETDDTAQGRTGQGRAGQEPGLTLFRTKSGVWLVLLSLRRKYSLMDRVTTPVCSRPSPSSSALPVAMAHMVMA